MISYSILFIFLIGMIVGTLVTLLTMLVLFAVGYNTIGTLLQVFSPETYIPTLRQLQEAKMNDRQKLASRGEKNK